MSYESHAVLFYGFKVEHHNDHWSTAKKHKLEYFIGGNHTVGGDNMFIGGLAKHADEYTPKTFKSMPHTSRLVQCRTKLKAFCEEVGIEYKDPEWRLIAWYG